MPRIVRLIFFSLAIGAALYSANAHAAAFVRPDAEQRGLALGAVSGETPTFQKLLEADADFPPIARPGPSDWLAKHDEPGQTFLDYRLSHYNRPDNARRIIYLLPLGEFPGDASPPLDALREFAEAFFQLETKIIPAYQPKPDEFHPRTRSFGLRQIRSTSVLDFLRQRVPPDAYCLLAVTMDDLYPSPSWNFVFGQATLAHRVGVYGFARYDPAFLGHGERGANYRALILKRSCKVLAHETGHMFGLWHCIYYECLLNGSNHLAETDARPPHLCPICLRKLHHCAEFDPVKRYRDLKVFYDKHGWADEAAWTQRQLDKIAPGPSEE